MSNSKASLVNSIYNKYTLCDLCLNYLTMQNTLHFTIFGILPERSEQVMCDKPVVKQVSRFQGCVFPRKWSPQSSCGYDMPCSLPPELGCFPSFYLF